MPSAITLSQRFSQPVFVFWFWLGGVSHMFPKETTKRFTILFILRFMKGIQITFWREGLSMSIGCVAFFSICYGHYNTASCLCFCLFATTRGMCSIAHSVWDNATRPEHCMEKIETHTQIWKNRVNLFPSNARTQPFIRNQPGATIFPTTVVPNPHRTPLCSQSRARTHPPT